MIIQESLSSRLLYLPLDLQEKVFMWLTYKGLKPVSEITAEKRNKAILKKLRTDKTFRESYVNSYNFNSKNSIRIKKWLKDAGLVFLPESEGDISWHIGKDINLVRKSIEILRKFDYKNEVESGVLFGFPREAAEIYARSRESSNKAEELPILWPGNRFKENFFKDKYFTPYLTYAINKNRLQQDSEVAKTWADTIRRDVPKLAQWFEKYEIGKFGH